MRDYRHQITRGYKVFETDHWAYTRDYYKLYGAATQFENTGASRGGLHLTYPGRDAVLAAAGPMASAVIQKMPNNPIVSASGADIQRMGESAIMIVERGGVERRQHALSRPGNL